MSMKNKSIILSFCLCLVVGSPIMAVPNTFTTGQVASADEVNENFTALESGIDSIRPMTPIAFGTVGAYGEQLPGRGAYTTSRIDYHYFIDLHDVDYDGTNLVIVVTVIETGNGCLAAWVRPDANANITVCPFNSDGNPAPTSFHFVVYQP